MNILSKLISKQVGSFPTAIPINWLSYVTPTWFSFINDVFRKFCEILFSAKNIRISVCAKHKENLLLCDYYYYYYYYYCCYYYYSGWQARVKFCKLFLFLVRSTIGSAEALYPLVTMETRTVGLFSVRHIESTILWTVYVFSYAYLE